MHTSLEKYIEEERFYKDVVEDGSDVIFVVDYDYNILYHNPSVRDTIGHQNLIGENFIEYLHPAIKKKVIESFEISKAHPYNSQIEFKFLCADDTYKYLEFNSINLKFKYDIEGLILDCRDISERKRDQEELIRAQKAKEQFLANMSHEIRTPINGIVGMINLLSDSPLTDEQAKYLEAIKHSAENLKVIINDILDFSAIESGKLKFEKIGFDLVQVIHNVIESLELLAHEKGLEIILDINKNTTNNRLILLGDPVRLSQILINLINNAIKFTHEGKITVSVRCSENFDNTANITFHISDTGIGIPKEKLKTIFETFKQADESITRKFGGTGLGLTISKQLVELQGGKISVTSEVGVGTTFTFVIPYEIGSELDIKEDEKEKAGPVKPIASTPDLQGMRVLLVEDNDINRLYAANILKKWHCDIEEAENGQIALEKLRRKDFDIVLMDIHMPVLDGLETAKSIRTSFQPPKKNIPIVAFTANALKGDKDKYLDAGMNAYISKPFTPNELAKVLTRFYRPGKKKNIQKRLIDLSYLRKMCNNDEGFVQEMISSFVEKTPELLAEMSKAADEQNWRQVGSLAHKIKPNLSFMGIHSLKDLVLEVEKSGKNQQDLDSLPAKAKELISTVNQAIQELKELA